MFKQLLVVLLAQLIAVVGGLAVAARLLLGLRECIERTSAILEPQQFGQALGSPKLALCSIGQIGGAGQAQDAVDVLRSRRSAQPQHDGLDAFLNVVNRGLIRSRELELGYQLVLAFDLDLDFDSDWLAEHDRVGVSGYPR